MKKRLEYVIADRLTQNREKCEFKKAFIPEGFSCVNICKFASFLAEEILSEFEIKGEKSS